MDCVPTSASLARAQLRAIHLPRVSTLNRMGPCWVMTPFFKGPGDSRWVLDDLLDAPKILEFPKMIGSFGGKPHHKYHQVPGTTRSSSLPCLASILFALWLKKGFKQRTGEQTNDFPTLHPWIPASSPPGPNFRGSTATFRPWIHARSHGRFFGSELRAVIFKSSCSRLCREAMEIASAFRGTRGTRGEGDVGFCITPWGTFPDKTVLFLQNPENSWLPLTGLSMFPLKTSPPPTNTHLSRAKKVMFKTIKKGIYREDWAHPRITRKHRKMKRET